MTKYIVSGQAWVDACEVIRCSECPFKQDGTCKLGAYIRSQPIYEPDRPHGEWIPCSERLPEEKGKYLCTTNYAIPPYHVFHPENDIYVDDVSIQKFDGKFIDSVVAWMPLPEPYKRGEAE